MKYYIPLILYEYLATTFIHDIMPSIMPSVCETCPIRRICRDKSPINIKGKTENRNYIECLRFTCPDGMSAAMNATDNTKPKEFNIAGLKTKLYLFGTRHKPTHRSRHFQRYVDDDGNIYFGRNSQTPARTGQHIFGRIDMY